MIFGLGAGKINITLEKYNFAPGETVAGKVFVELKKPTIAKRLNLALMGVRETTSRVKNSRGASSMATRSDFIHNFEMPLKEEGEYQSGEYSFEVKIPSDVSVLQAPALDGTIGVIAKAAMALATASGANARVHWYIEASLEVPKAFDIKKKVDITVG
ncbi:MAG: hypothetical protein AAB444_02595 [Patescibacteria group bacterium]